MTANQVLQRIKNLTLAHKQIRSFKKGLASDLFTDKGRKYPAACLQDDGGSISLSSHQATFNYRLFLLDLVHVSKDSKDNEDDVLSDMFSIGMDLLAQFNHGAFNDWKISVDNTVEYVVEGDNDLHAGVTFSISVSVIFDQNVCQVPSELINYEPTENEMKHVYDIKIEATGEEGNVLDISEIKGKKILFVTRGSAPIYKVSTAPESNEYVWNDDVITLGAATVPQEPFLILYRNY